MLGTVFHYAVVQPEDDHDRCYDQRNNVIAMHERMGYRQGGAYNGHFCQHGGKWISYLGPNQATGHTWANLNLHAWCYLATVGTPVTSPAAQAAYDLTFVEPTGRDQIYPHSAFYATSCCGDPLREWIAAGAFPPNIPLEPRKPRSTMWYCTMPGPAGPGNPRVFAVDGGIILYEIPYGDPRRAEQYGIHVEALDSGLPIRSGEKPAFVGAGTVFDQLVRRTDLSLTAPGGGGVAAGPLNLVLTGQATPA